jgi:L-aminopeptidase/D-esterase-like protein
LTTPSGRLRARAHGVRLAGTPGAHDAITDVAGVEVGYATVVGERADGDRAARAIRSGVTAIHPRGAARTGEPCAAGWYALNGNGEMTGTTWIEETGLLWLPVAITSTHAVGPVHRGVIEWVTSRHPMLRDTWLLPVVAETWDGYLHDVAGDHVTAAHVTAALDGARGGPIDEGSVGGGTGMRCYGYKGGSGTASRLVVHGDRHDTVGVFVQANFGARIELTIAGVPVGRMLRDDDPELDRPSGHAAGPPPGAGSVIVVVATDAPLLPGQCKALARRVPLGLARTGTSGSHFSGDLFLAFSTANAGRIAAPVVRRAEPVEALDHYEALPWTLLDPYFEAVVQATEEAVLNALFANEAMTSGDRRLAALPAEPVIALLRARGAVEG